MQRKLFFRGRNRNKGFTLVELGIVLAIMGLGLYYVIGKLSETNNESKSQALVQDFTGIVTRAKQLYATQQSYNGVTMAILRDNQVFPAQWNVAGVITGPYTGAVAAAAGTFVNANDSLIITIPNIPQNMCSSIVKTLERGIEQIAVAGVQVKAFQGQINLATLGTQCTSAANVAIAMEFGKL